MDIYKSKWTRLQNEVFRILCMKSGEELTKRNISKLLKVSPTAVSNSLKGLEKEGIVIVDKQKGMNFSKVSLNFDSPKVISLKRVENLKVIYESGFVKFLEEKFAGSTIILFGSYSYGEDTSHSDIDIAIIGSKEKEVNLGKFEKVLGREINVNFYLNVKEINRNLKNNILNGITLVGGVELLALF